MLASNKSLQCPGCFPIYQPNQLAHCEMGGCLWCPSTKEDDETYARILLDLENIMADTEVASAIEAEATTTNTTHIECCICYEEINKEKNNCVTECGHMFCLKCLVNTMYHDTWSCPYCRTNLIDVKPEHDADADADDYTEYSSDLDLDDDDDEPENDQYAIDINNDDELLNWANNWFNNNNNDNDNDNLRVNRRYNNPVNELEEGEIIENDQEESEQDEDDPEQRQNEEYKYYCPIDELTQRVEIAGFTKKDLIYMLLERYYEQYTEEQTIQMINRFDNIIYDADTEHYERIELNRQDVNVNNL